MTVIIPSGKKSCVRDGSKMTATTTTATIIIYLSFSEK